MRLCIADVMREQALLQKNSSQPMKRYAPSCSRICAVRHPYEHNRGVRRAARLMEHRRSFAGTNQRGNP